MSRLIYYSVILLMASFWGIDNSNISFEPNSCVQNDFANRIALASYVNGGDTAVNPSNQGIGIHDAGAAKKPSPVFKILFIIVAFLFLGTIAVMVIYIKLYHRTREALIDAQRILRRIKKIHNKEIEEYKGREVSVRIKETQRRNSLVAKIKTRLLRMKEGLPPNHHALFNSSINEMDRLTERDMWSEFERCFLEIYPRFIKKLKANYSDLTPEEIKVCAMIRVSLTSKEISEILDISIKSIESMRNKLRKKFRISSNDVFLSDFLRDFC